MLAAVAFLLSDSTFDIGWQTAVPGLTIPRASKSRGDLASLLLFLLRNNLCRTKCAVTVAGYIVVPGTSEHDCI